MVLDRSSAMHSDRTDVIDRTRRLLLFFCRYYFRGERLRRTLLSFCSLFSSSSAIITGDRRGRRGSEQGQSRAQGRGGPWVTARCAEPRGSKRQKASCFLRLIRRQNGGKPPTPSRRKGGAERRRGPRRALWTLVEGTQKMKQQVRDSNQKRENTDRSPSLSAECGGLFSPRPSRCPGPGNGRRDRHTSWARNARPHPPPQPQHHPQRRTTSTCFGAALLMIPGMEAAVAIATAARRWARGLWCCIHFSTASSSSESFTLAFTCCLGASILSGWASRRPPPQR